VVAYGQPLQQCLDELQHLIRMGETSMEGAPVQRLLDGEHGLALTGSTSAQQRLTKSSSGSQAKPSSSTSRCARVGPSGPWSSRAPIDSPASSPNAAM
jgi:hypothetical protein